MLEFQELVNCLKFSFDEDSYEFRSLNKIRNYLLNENGEIMPFTSPLGVQFEITADCNLSCRHCYNDSYVGKEKNELTDAEWIKVAKELKEMGILALTISGGEPLLKEELVREIIDVFNGENNTSIGMITNGWLVTQNFVNYLSEISNFKWVQVSIDSSLPEEHDWIRGRKGSWERAINAVRLFKESGISVRVAHTCNRHNYKQLWKMAELCVLLGVEELIYTPILDAGRAHYDRMNLLLRNEEMKEFYDVSNKVIKRYSPYLKISKATDKLMYYKRSSLLPTMAMLIRPNGDVKIDCSIPFVFGNVKKNKIKEIWKNKACKGWGNEKVIDFIMKSIDGCQKDIPYVTDDIEV